MINAWIVIREEKHSDDKFWVCLNREDALTIARDVRDYWKEFYKPRPDEIDEELYGNGLFHFSAKDLFRIYVEPQNIREEGESTVTEDKT